MSTRQQFRCPKCNALIGVVLPGGVLEQKISRRVGNRIQIIFPGHVDVLMCGMWQPETQSNCDGRLEIPLMHRVEAIV